MELDNLVPAAMAPKTDKELKTIRARYEPFRALSTRVNHKLVERISREVLTQGAKKLGLFHGGTLVFDSETDMDILMDFCIHSMLRSGRNLVDECLEENRAAFAKTELEVLEAMQAARYAILIPDRVERGYGVYCRDATASPLGSRPLFLADRMLSQNNVSSLTLATRIIPVDDFYITGGAGMPLVSGAAKEVRRALTGWYQRPSATLPGGADGLRTREEDAELASVLVPLLLRHQGSSEIAYAGPGDDPAKLMAAKGREYRADDGDFDNELVDATAPSEPYRRGPKVGRNDPCPCGSGLKHKKCCGKTREVSPTSISRIGKESDMTKAKQPAKAAKTKDNRLFTLEVALIGGPPIVELPAKKNQISRTIEMRGDQTLASLHETIFDAFDRDDEHLYEFQLGAKKPMDRAARRYGMKMDADDFFDDDNDGDAAETAIGSIDLKAGDVFFYWFDFGDDWMHRIKVLAIAEEAPKAKYPRVTKSVGKSPAQYPDFDEDEDEE